MKLRIVFLSAFVVLCSMLAAAGTIYENGPKNDDSNDWNIVGNRYFVSDSFTVSGGNSTVSGISIWLLIFPTDHNPTAEITITSQANDGNIYFDQILQFSESNCYAAGWGYNFCEETATWTNGPALQSGTYWVNLKNGSLPSGGPAFWNQNAGVGCNSPGCPSQAEYFGGTVPSEAFTIMGSGGTDRRTAPTNPNTSSIFLFGGGFAGLAGMLRRLIG